MALTWKKIRRGIKYPILVFFIKIFILFIRLFPRKWVLRFTKRVGGLASLLIKSEREKTINNLKYIYSDKSDEEIKRMAREVFQHQAMNFGDYVRTLHYKTPQQFSKIVDIEGEEHLKNAYEKGKGVLCLMSHTGSWEFSAILPSVYGYETSALSRPLPNPRIDKLIVEARQSRGMKNISRGDAYAKLLVALSEGDCLIIMIDQDTAVPGVFIPFLGKTAYTPTGAARLALDSGSEVVPIFIKRQKNNKHLLKILPALPTINTGDVDKDVLENTVIYSDTIADFIKENPTQWVWMHERWKTTPDNIGESIEKRRIRRKRIAEREEALALLEEKREARKERRRKIFKIKKGNS